MYYLLQVTFCSDSERAQNKNDHLEQLTQRFYLTRSTQSMSRLFTITQYISTYIRCKKSYKMLEMRTFAFLNEITCWFFPPFIYFQNIECIYALKIFVSIPSSIHLYSSITNRNHSRRATGESLFVCKESWKSICNEIQQLKRRSDNKRKECTQNWQYFILNDVQRSMNLSNKKAAEICSLKARWHFYWLFLFTLKSKHMF